MSVDSDLNRVQISGSGTITPIAFNRKVFAATDIVGSKEVIATGVVTSLVQGTDYSVTGAGNTSTGVTITPLVAPAVGERWVFWSDQANTQASVYTENDRLPAKTTEYALDKQSIGIQDQSRYNDLALRYPDTEDSSTSGALPVVNDRKSKALGFDANGDISMISVNNVSSSNASGITYDPAGAGAVPTTVEAKLREVVSANEYGTTGDGAADDSTEVANAALAAKDGTLVFNNGTYKITTDIKLDNVLLVFNNATITGTGSIRGVITNESIPASHILVEQNLVLSKDRNPTVLSGDFFLDPCLGDDTNAGTASSTPVKTLSKLRTLINTEIALASDVAITCIVRSGRIEIPTQVDFDTSQSTATVTIKANTAEKPYMSGPLKWFARSGSTAAHDSTNIYALYAADLDNKEIPITTTSKNENRSLSRNALQAITESSNTCTISVDTDVEAMIDGSTNLGFTRLNVIQSFSSSVYHGIAISTSNMTFTKPAAQNSTYFNGFDTGVNDGYAPYYIEGLSFNKTAKSWCNLGSTIDLPDEGNIFFSPTQLSQPVLVSANKYIFDGVGIQYHQPTEANVEDNYTGTANATNAFMYISGDDCEFINSSINDVQGGGIFGDGNNCHLNDNICKNIGHTCFFIGLDTNPESITGGEMERNEIQFWGRSNAGGKGIGYASADLEIKDNHIFNGASQAIGGQADQDNSIAIEVFRNVLHDLGMPNGIKSEQYMINDCGGYYFNGLAQTTNHQFNQNVVYNVNGHVGCRGVYIDNAGVGGTYNENLVFNINGRSFDNRNVGGNTDANSYSRNIIFGTMIADDQTSGTYFKNCVIGRGGQAQNTIGSALTVTDLNSGKLSTGRVRDNYAEIRDYKTLLDDGLTTLILPTIAPYITDRLSSAEIYEGSFTPVLEGITTAGAGTYTTQRGDYKIDGDIITFNLRLTWTAHTGTGNIQVDLSDLPYVAENISGMVFPVFLWSNVSATTGYVAANTKVITIDPTVAMSGTGSIAIQGRFPV